MNKGKLMGLTSIFLIAILALSTMVSAIAITVDKVELDDEELTIRATNRLDVERDDKIEVLVKFTPSQDVDDVTIEAMISGYEYGDFDSISDRTHNFDADANVTYIKRLWLTLPEDVEEDDYRLRIIITNRNGDELIQNYELKLDVPRHALKIEDVVLYPSSEVMSGQALLATVRLRNHGEKDEEDVRVEISIPEIGLSGVDYIDEIEFDEEEETEEIFLRVPSCAKPGKYVMNIKAWYDRKHDMVEDSVIVTVVEDETCRPLPMEEAKDEPTPIVTAAVVAYDEDKETSLRGFLEGALVVLLVVLAIVGLAVGIRKLKENGEEEF